MAYIGKQPTIGNFVKLDTITTSATATYNLLNGGVAYSPQSANHCIVSLNGVIQSPGTSFTISGSTIVFASALTATDVIDFILVLGDVLNIGTPSDATVGFSKVTSNLITGATAETSIAGGDSLLIYDDSASALRKMTKTNLFSGISNTPAFSVQKTNTQSISNATFTLVQWNTELFDTNNCFDIATNYRFTPTEAGKYAFDWSMQFAGSASGIHTISLFKNGSRLFDGTHIENETGTTFINGSAVAGANGSSDYFDIRAYQSSGSSMNIGYEYASYFNGYKLIGA